MTENTPQNIDSRFKSNWKVQVGHKDWLTNYKKTHESYPICIEIDPSNSCPLNCEHCCWSDFRDEHKNTIPREKMLSLVEEISGLGTKSIIWTGGGDPLANPATPEAICKGAELGLENAMFTNGVLLTPTKSDLIGPHLNWIRFNLAGDSPDNYASIHRVPSELFTKVCENIKYFTSRFHGKVEAGIGTAVSPENFDRLKHLPELTGELGLDYFQAKLDFNRVGSDDYLTWWNAVAVPFFSGVKEKLGIKVRVFADPVVRSTAVQFCHAHRMITAITADGRVSFCKMRRDQENTSLGSIYEATLKDIFNSANHKRIESLIHPHTCEILRNFCPYRTTNESVDLFLNGEDVPIPAGTKFEEKHINFF